MPAAGLPTLPGFTLLEILGSGGMGIVYLAFDVRLNRRLALKVMLPEFAADARAKDGFLREARAAAQISHDNNKLRPRLESSAADYAAPAF